MAPMPEVHAPDRGSAPGVPSSELGSFGAPLAAAAAARLELLDRFVRTHARPPSSLASVRKLVASANGTGMDTSEGLLFNHSVWGRDRVITAFDVLATSPEIARQTILTLARLQGVRLRRRSEEEPGRIHNERRDLVSWDGPLHLRAFFSFMLSPLWGGTRRGYTTYFATDSTPLYVLLTCRYARLDRSILREVVSRHDGSTVTVLESLIEACDWILGHVTDDDLVEAPKHNLLSLPGQTWRDGPTSNFDGDGRMANIADPVAYLDIQMLAMDALVGAAGLLRTPAAGVTDGGLLLPAAHGGRPSPAPAAAGPSPAPQSDTRSAEDLAALFEERARELRAATLARFWMEDRQYFGFARDKNGNGRSRLLTAVQSNAGWLLLSSLFDDLPQADRERYVGGIVRTLFGPDMLTDAGVRGRSLQYSNPHFRNYHENVWPMDTFMIAKGLRRQGFRELAEQLEARLLNTANLLGSNYEFVVVDDAGRIVHPAMTRARAEEMFPSAAAPLPTEMLPEVNIAWSVTAMLRTKRERVERCRQAAQAAAAVSGNGQRHARESVETTGGPETVAPATGETGLESPGVAPVTAAHEVWITALTAEILSGIPDVRAARSMAELLERAAAISPFYLSIRSGLRRAATVVAVQGFGGVIPRKLLREARAKVRERARSRDRR
jgi:glycogen debranching enzyme